MNEPTAADWLDAWASVIGAVAAIGALVVASEQVRKLVTQLKQSNFSALLTLEIEMNNRKQRVDDAAREVRLLEGEQCKQKIVIAYEHLEGCMENWLNLVDRLAFCIRRKYLREKDFKSEYKRYFESLVTCNPDYFRDGTPYENIVDLCNKWGISIPPQTRSS